MLVKRSLRSGYEEGAMLSGLVKGSTLQGWIDGEAVLAKAEARGRDIIAQAEQEAQAIRAEVQQQAEHWLGDYREQVAAEFWQQANEVQAQWEQQNEALWQNVEGILEPLLHQALAHILAQVPPAEKIRAVIKHLLVSKPAAGAEVRCAPEAEETVRTMLAPYGDRWRVVPDALVLADEVVFQSSAGTFSCDWQGIMREAQALHQADNELSAD